MGNEIIYNREAKEIQFIGKITSFIFYTQLFDALRNHYKENGIKKIPVFSFVYVDYFEPLVVPNLVGIGKIINQIHNREKVPLRFAQIYSTKFLDNIGFFTNVGDPQIYLEEIHVVEHGRLLQKHIPQKRGLSIYDFDSRYLGFYNNQKEQEFYNLEHKIRVYPDDSFNYYSVFIDTNSTEEELDAIRTNKYNSLTPFVKIHFENILSKINDPIQTKTILKVLTEIICNSVLYSGSFCAAMLQARTIAYVCSQCGNKTLEWDEICPICNEQETIVPQKSITISISDIGVGFEYSFEKKKEKFGKEYRDVFNQFSEQEQAKYNNYLYIFEALQFSKKKRDEDNRNNLYTLLQDIVMNNDGKMRIHYIDTQVVFNSKRCNQCKKIEPIKCSHCLLKAQKQNIQESPVRFFKSKFQGIHIEVELNF